MPKIISLHDVLEPLKHVLLASRDVIISSQICGSNSQKVFTLGDGCWLPIKAAQADWAQDAEASSKLRSGRPLKLKLLHPSWQSAKLLLQ